MRTRSCDAPKPKYGGAQCKGSYYQTILCNTEDCPGNGGFLLKVGCPKLLHGCELAMSFILNLAPLEVESRGGATIVALGRFRPMAFVG